MVQRLSFRAKSRRAGGGVYLALVLLVLVTVLACSDLLDPEADRTGSEATPTWTLPPTPDSDSSAWSPLGTPGPAVSPTPIVHVVQAGETLVSIALDYDVDVELLQWVNNISDPRLLRAGQQLVIPTGDEAITTPLPLLLPTPTPLAAGVRGEGCYQTPVGSLQCLGEIVNTGAFTITNVHVNVALVDASGGVLLGADAQTAAHVVPPGGRSPFRLLFTTPPEGWAGLSVVVARAEVAGLLPPSYVPMIVVESEGAPDDAQYEVTGVVENASRELLAESVSVIVTAYNEEGYVIAVRQMEVEVDEALAPGEQAEFALLLSYHDGPPVQTNVVAQGRVVVEQ